MRVALGDYVETGEVRFTIDKECAATQGQVLEDRPDVH